jgi:hypothetical protein
MGKPISEAARLRRRADILDAEAEMAAAKGERPFCGECGRRIPMSPEERKAFKKASARMHKLRDAERADREATDAP